jgi:hypothetical protein
MKRAVRSFVLAGLWVSISLAVSSCTMLGVSTKLTGDLGDPSTHAIFFGAIGGNQGVQIAKYSTPLDVSYIQMNPSGPKEMLYTWGGIYQTKNGVQYSKPLLAGGSYKLISMSWDRTRYTQTHSSTTEYAQTHTNYYTLTGRNPWDIQRVHPGLTYYGAWEYSDKEEDGSGNLEKAKDGFKLRRRSSPSELECLREMSPTFQDTIWQAAIEARIKELSK